MLGGRADSLRSLRERWTVGRRMDGARAESPWRGRGSVHPKNPEAIVYAKWHGPVMKHMP